MKKTTAYGRKLAREREKRPNAGMARDPALDSPVGRAVYNKDSADSKAELVELMTGISVRIYLTQQEECDHKLLASLALMLAIGTQIGVWTALKSPQTKQVHAALRAVIQLSIEGGRWQVVQAKALHEAAQLASTSFLAEETISEHALQYAHWLANRVRCGTAKLTDVVGAEIYNKTQICAVPAGIDCY